VIVTGMSTGSAPGRDALAGRAEHHDRPRRAIELLTRSWCQGSITGPRMRRYCTRRCFVKARRERERVRAGAAYRARQERPTRRPLALAYLDVPPEHLPVPEPGWRKCQPIVAGADRQ
jgi:hypothetical protein